MRRSFTLLAPVAVGGIVLAAAAAYPASTVHGSSLTGPMPPKSVVPAFLDSDYGVRWLDHDSAVLLRVRDGLHCRPVLRGETSTAPARIEVDLERPTGAACFGRRRWWDFRLAPPTVRSPEQTISVYVDGRRRELPVLPTS